MTGLGCKRDPAKPRKPMPRASKPLGSCKKCPHRPHTAACRSCACAYRTEVKKAKPRTAIARTTTLERGAGPKQRNPKLERGRRKFKAEVFARYGDRCVFCGLPGSIDPAHIIPTNILGVLRFADVRLARPAHRRCHEEQHDGKRRFPVDVVRDAYAAHNAVAVCRLECPV